MIARPLRLTVLLAALPGALAGCMRGGDNYPSLAPRPIEARGFPALAPAPAAPVPPDPAVAAQVTALEQGSIDADRDFAAELPHARILAAKAGAAGSESWVVAQQAISSLETIRARGRSGLPALGDLQRDLLSSGDPARIAAAGEVEATAARVAAREAAQSDTLSTLEAKLGAQ